MNWRSIWNGFAARVLWIRYAPTQRERRIWVSALYLGVAAEDTLVAAFKLQPGTPSLWGAVWRVCGLLIIVLLWSRLERWSIPVIPTSALAPAIPVDERQEAVRDGSYRRAYRAALLVALVSAAATYAFQDDLSELVRRMVALNLLFPFLLQIILLFASLPVAILAWTEPDDPLAKMEKAG